MTDEAGGHVSVTRRQWDEQMSAWFERYARYARSQWAADEPYWGMWCIPQSRLPVLPADLAGVAAVEPGCGSGYLSAWLARRGAPHAFGEGRNHVILRDAEDPRARGDAALPEKPARAWPRRCRTTTSSTTVFVASIWVRSDALIRRVGAPSSRCECIEGLRRRFRLGWWWRRSCVGAAGPFWDGGCGLG